MPPRPASQRTHLKGHAYMYVCMHGEEGKKKKKKKEKEKKSKTCCEILPASWFDCK